MISSAIYVPLLVEGKFSFCGVSPGKTWVMMRNTIDSWVSLLRYKSQRM